MTTIKDLEAAIKIQCRDGGCENDPYMHGMAVGMIFALATVKGEEPNYSAVPGRKK